MCRNRRLCRAAVLLGVLCVAFFAVPAGTIAGDGPSGDTHNGALLNAPRDRAYVGVLLQQGRVQTDPDWNENINVWVLSDWVDVLTPSPCSDVKSCED